MKYGKSICLLALMLSAQQLSAAAYSNEARIVIKNNTAYDIVATRRVIEGGSEKSKNLTIAPHTSMELPEPKSSISRLYFTVPKGSYSPAYLYEVTSEIRKQGSLEVHFDGEVGYFQDNFKTTVLPISVKGQADISSGVSESEARRAKEELTASSMLIEKTLVDIDQLLAALEEPAEVDIVEQALQESEQKIAAYKKEINLIKANVLANSSYGNLKTNYDRYNALTQNISENRTLPSKYKKILLDEIQKNLYLIRYEYYNGAISRQIKDIYLKNPSYDTVRLTNANYQELANEINRSENLSTADRQSLLAKIKKEQQKMENDFRARQSGQPVPVLSGI